MSIHTVQPRLLAAAAMLAFLSVETMAAPPQRARKARRAQAHVTKPAAAKLPCGDQTAFQVLLDRQGFSPGEIDGQGGPNLSRAITAFQQARSLTGTGKPDCETWQALGGEQTKDITIAYTVTDADAKGPFVEKIPTDLVEQASLPSLGYTSIVEKLAERFHASQALLKKLNAASKFQPGDAIQVPNVTPFDPDAKAAPNPSAADITIQIARDESAVRATRADGTLAFFAPVTTGSEHDPLPQGDWKVTGVDWRPPFHYNPDLFWDAKSTHTKATIKPGPNNPVGVVWIGLSLPHYGIHGTPIPGNVAHTESHGCVRLTNWDAVRLATLVKPGTRVLFR